MQTDCLIGSEGSYQVPRYNLYNDTAPVLTLMALVPTSRNRRQGSSSGVRCSTLFHLLILVSLLILLLALILRLHELSSTIKSLSVENVLQDTRLLSSEREREVLLTEIRQLKSQAAAVAISTATEVPHIADTSPIDGVAAVCCLDGPGWLQKRYTLSITNIMRGLPSSYKVQPFYKPSGQSTFDQCCLYLGFLIRNTAYVRTQS